MAERRWRLVRAGRDAVPASVRRFSARARRNRLRTALPWLVAATVVVALAIGVAVVYLTPVFSVERVRVEGTGVLSVDQVRVAAAVRLGEPLARVDTDEVHRRIAALAPVRVVDVSREFPGTVVIRIAERTAVAVVSRVDGMWLIDAVGVPYLSITERPVGLALLRIPAPGPDDQTTRAALTVLNALPPALRELLAVLVAEAPARIRLELVDGRVIIWGDASQSDAKGRVAVVMITKPGRTLDVSAPELVTVR